jgi:hypothetical protein
MIQRWGLLAASALYGIVALESYLAGRAPDQVLNGLGMMVGLAMLGLPVWLPRHLSEGANAGYAYGPERPLLLRIQRVGVVVASALVLAGVVVGWPLSDGWLHRALAVVIGAMALGVARAAWRARRILALPMRR